MFPCCVLRVIWGHGEIRSRPRSVRKTDSLACASGLHGAIIHSRPRFSSVAKWGDTLDPHAASGLPPRVVTISSDVLGVGQAPPAPGQKRSSIEMAAGGNVLVEGESFTARSARLTWSEAKDLLVFEGDGRSDAQLYRQAKVGAATSSASAGKILYWRAINRVDVDDARYLDLDQLNAGAGGIGGGLRTPGFGSAPAAKPVSRPLPGT
jgi:hypothetical protein